MASAQILLTSAITIENGARLVMLTTPAINDEASTMTTTLDLRSPGGTNFLISRRVLTTRNGLCDMVQAIVPANGSNIEEKLGLTLNALTIADGFDQAIAAWAGGGATAAAKRRALLTTLLALGQIHSSLAGTVS